MRTQFILLFFLFFQCASKSPNRVFDKLPTKIKLSKEQTYEAQSQIGEVRLIELDRRVKKTILDYQVDQLLINLSGGVTGWIHVKPGWILMDLKTKKCQVLLNGGIQVTQEPFGQGEALTPVFKGENFSFSSFILGKVLVQINNEEPIWLSILKDGNYICEFD